VEGMTAPEVARMTGARVNTVYSRLRLARARFEEIVAEPATEETGDGRAQ
jgi:DNA-directed RNA polymerase specialized sigma24 family protein